MHASLPHAMLNEIAAAIDLDAGALDRVEWTGTDRLPSCFAVTELAAGSIAAAGLALSEVIGTTTASPRMSVDLRLASLWFGLTIQPIGWTLPAVWDAIAGDYRTQDGWIKLHTNAPHHKAAALSVLDVAATRDDVAQAVARWSADGLEQAIVDAGGCAATLRDRAAWQVHPQGVHVAAAPLFMRSPAAAAADAHWRPDPQRPLVGIRVFDLTRILAGPVATRFLAAYGADVLRIDLYSWEEPGVAPEVTPGKRRARLDLSNPDDRGIFERLLADADILVHGYRADALDRLGYTTP